MALLSPPYLSSAINRFLNPNSNPNFPLSHCPNPLFFRYRRNLKLSASASSKSHHQNPNSPLPASGQPEPLRQLAAASAVLFLGLGISICSAAAASARIPPVPAANRPTVVAEQRIPGTFDLSHIMCVRMHKQECEHRSVRTIKIRDSENWDCQWRVLTKLAN